MASRKKADSRSTVKVKCPRADTAVGKVKVTSLPVARTSRAMASPIKEAAADAENEVMRQSRSLLPSAMANSAPAMDAPMSVGKST